MDPNPQVRLATEADHEAAAEALALAFADDPAWAHLIPDPATRAERLLVFFPIELENARSEHHQIWVTEDGGGAPVSAGRCWRRCWSSATGRRSPPTWSRAPSATGSSTNAMASPLPGPSTCPPVDHRSARCGGSQGKNPPLPRLKGGMDAIGSCVDRSVDYGYGRRRDHHDPGSAKHPATPRERGQAGRDERG